MYFDKNRLPEFKNIAAVLEKKAPERPTLFEFFINRRLEKLFTGSELKQGCSFKDYVSHFVHCFSEAGYDYATIQSCGWGFSHVEDDSADGKDTISLNHRPTIYDRASFDAYTWPDVNAVDYSGLSDAASYMPKSMKLMVACPGGVLENVIGLTGYDNLCMMIYDDPELVSDIFDKVGQALLLHYKKVLEHKTVGILMSNDDWGFNTQTMLAPDDMRKYVFPWHKRYVELAHEKGIYAVLHSCGNYRDILSDIIDDMKYDGRHSYEDNIIPVEQAYEQLKGRIAVLGGIDVSLMTNGPAEEIFDRSRAMLERSAKTGGYALGSGNSIPSSIPDEHYLAMIKACVSDTL